MHGITRVIGVVFIVIFFSVLFIGVSIKKRELQALPAYPVSPYRRPPVSPYLRQAVFARNEMYAGAFCCSYCGGIGGAYGPDGLPWEVDHIVPYSCGGPTQQDNLCLSCSTCNRRKGVGTWSVRYP